MGRKRLLTILSLAKFYYLPALITAVLLLISEIPSLNVLVRRLAWAHSPWRACPYPYGSTEYLSQPAREFSTLLGNGVGMSICLTLLVALLHTLTFAAVVVAHLWFGWPQYWKDIRLRLNLFSPLVLSARRTWWVWPVSQFTWLLLDAIAIGYWYAFYPIIDTGFPYLAANIGAVCLMNAVVSAHALRAAVTDALGSDDLRCCRCGYLLRGLESQRCPECGCACSDPAVSRWFGLRFCRSRTPKKSGPILSAAFIVALLLAPVWLPLGLGTLPRNWLRYVPRAIRPDWQVLSPNPNAYPVRFDAVCVVRHADAMAVVQFDPRAGCNGMYLSRYWADATDFARRQPARTRSAGQLTATSHPSVAVGPWTFDASLGGEEMFWLYRPDETYSVEIFRDDHLPDEVRWGLREEP